MTKRELPLVYIVILNYNNWQDTIECINSLLKISYSNYKIVIIDNNSSNQSLSKIKQYLSHKNYEYIYFKNPELSVIHKKNILLFTLIQSPYNGGYGYGNNIGIKYALSNKADYVLILNNDTIVDPNFLKPMVDICEEDKTVGIVSGKILYYDNPDTIWFNGGVFHKWTGKVEHLNFNEKDLGQVPQKEITFITGCMWLIPRQVFEKVGLINEEYFMYIEDLEFSTRVLAKGFKLKISNKSFIYHKITKKPGGKFTKFSVYWRTRNMNIFIRKNEKNLFRKIFSLFMFNLRTSILLVKYKKIPLIPEQLKGFIHSIIKRGKNVS